MREKVALSVAILATTALASQLDSPGIGCDGPTLWRRSLETPFHKKPLLNTRTPYTAEITRYDGTKRIVTRFVGFPYNPGTRLDPSVWDDQGLAICPLEAGGFLIQAHNGPPIMLPNAEKEYYIFAYSEAESTAKYYEFGEDALDVYEIDLTNGEISLTISYLYSGMHS